jgi:hypothetical protein
MKGKRALYQASISHFLQESPEAVIGAIAQAHSQAIEHLQTGAWRAQINLLQSVLRLKASGNILFELLIPRMGRRADVALILENIIFILEFKVGADRYSAQDMRQVHGYALDLHHFHEGSHDKTIIPILVATKAPELIVELKRPFENVYPPLLVNADNLATVLQSCMDSNISRQPLNLKQWFESGYKPTPTIIEAAQALYANHDVTDIARNDAGAQNLHLTSATIEKIVHSAKQNGHKTICFVTGVPGAGKTLVGLNVATASSNAAADEHAVFLSGNGPLVHVLTEALARDSRARLQHKTMDEASRAASGHIQNIHRFRDDYVGNKRVPPERVVIFDEAQRAWNLDSTRKFMLNKRGQQEFDQSEPAFLMGVMDRHHGWCVIIALVGGGQEINTGEAGLQGWIDACSKEFSHWNVVYSAQLTQPEYAGKNVDVTELANAKLEANLHLSTSMRSFRAETLSHMVHHLIANDAVKSRQCYESFKGRFPIKITRDLSIARAWLRHQSLGNQTKGVIASSGALRLKPDGLFVKNIVSAAHWFLDGPDDVRSSHYLEDVATEFDIQGLELDWCLVAWDADLRYQAGNFEHWKFKGSEWERRRQLDAQRYLENAYRVLLTRARQGMVIFLPKGGVDDATRQPHFYEETYTYLLACGVESIEDEGAKTEDRT